MNNKYKLNIGGGYKRYDGFMNCDMDPLTKPDFLMELGKDPFPLEDNSVIEIKAWHILEHISDGFFNLMQEIYRVCEDGSILDIQVPHHRSEIWYGDTSHVRFITTENMRQFSKSYNQYHIQTFNSSSGFGLRLDVDFEIVEFDFIVSDIWKPRFLKMSQEEIVEVSRNFNNVYDETHMKLQVIK